MLVCVTTLLLTEPYHHDAFFLDGQPCAAPESPPARWVIESAPRGAHALVLAPGLARVRLLRERAAAGWPRPESIAPGWRQQVGLSVGEREALAAAEGREGLALMLASWAGVSP